MPTQAEIFAQSQGWSGGSGGTKTQAQLYAEAMGLPPEAAAPPAPVATEADRKPNLDALPGTMDLLGSAVTGARKTLIPYEEGHVSDIWEGPKELLTHPVDSIGMLLKNMAGAHGQQASDASASMNRFIDKAMPGGEGIGAALPELLKTIGHGAAAAVPLVGPAVGGLVEQGAEGVRTGDPSKVFESGGGLAAMLAQAALAKGKGGAAAEQPAGTGRVQVPLAEQVPTKGKMYWTEDPKNPGWEYATKPDGKIRVRRIEDAAQGPEITAQQKAQIAAREKGPAPKAVPVGGIADLTKEILNRAKPKAEAPAPAKAPAPKVSSDELAILDKPEKVRTGADRTPIELESVGVRNRTKVPGASATDLISQMDTATKPVPEPLPAVEMTRAERTGSRAAGFLEKAVEASFPGAKAFDKFRGKQQSQLIDGMAEQAVKNISKFKGTREEIGVRIQQETAKALETVKANAHMDYAAIDDLAKGAKAPTAGLKAFASTIQKELKGLRKLTPKSELEKSTAMFDAIMKAPTKVDFKTMQGFRSNLLSKVRMIREEIPGRADGIIKKLTELTDQAMESGAGKDSELMTKVRKANANWKDMNETFNESVLKRMTEAAPEKVPDLLSKSSLDDIRRFKRTLPANTVQDVKTHIIRGLLDDATQGELPAKLLDEVKGRLTGEPVQGGRKLKGSSLRAGLERFGEDKLRELFTKDEIKGVLDVADTAEKVGAPARSLVGAFVNGRLFYAAGKGLAGAAHGDFTGLIEPAAMYAGIKIASKIMTRPGGASTVNNYLKALADANASLPAKLRFQLPPAKETAASKFWGARLAAMYKANESDSPDKD